MKNETVIILDFGGQYNQLIARRVRDLHVYCEILPCTIGLEQIKAKKPAGIILTGGPDSVTDPNSLHCDKAVFELGIPILGICYGCQLMAHLLGGKIQKPEKREYGKTTLSLKESLLFKDIETNTVCWMSHTDQIENLPNGFHSIAHTDSCPVAAMECRERNLYGVQFHPEVQHTKQGNEMLQNFLFQICGCKGDWIIQNFIEESVQALCEKIRDKKVLCALSGGVDSSVAAALIHRAAKDNLTCIFVDHGLLRKDEGDQVEKIFKEQFHMNLIRVNAQKRFFERLAGISEPEKKRKIIGEEFIRVFEEEAKKIGKVDYLVQGTIYPDVVESGVGGNSALIKSHHNVGGLPDCVDFKEIIEPLRDLFKDEVRAAGLTLGIPEYLVYRQPFPGPGLGVRIIGDITEEKVALLQDADAIFREEITKAKLEGELSQYFAVLTDMRSVGVMGDERTYDYTVALRAVTTTDFMTAEWADIPHDVLACVSNRIVNEVKHVNRVVYDITTKPPATIEWE